MALVLFGVFVALTIGLFLVPGVGILAIIPLVLAVLVGVWLVFTFATNSSPSREVRRSSTRTPELLGPGGPDDPDRGR
jgi:hypothetical protein